MSMRTPDSRVSRKHSTYPGFTDSSNPFDSDSESDENVGPARAFSAPPLSKGNSKVSPFRHTEDGGSGTSSLMPMDFSATKGRYKNEFRGIRGFENQPLQEVENYVVYKADETTRTFNKFSGSNPFDSDSESENVGPARAFSAPPLSKGNSKVSPFRRTEDGGSGTSSFKPMDFSAAKGRYKNEFRDSGGLENQLLQEVENYALYEAEQTTRTINNCLKIAEVMREDAAGILVNLDQQGEQINRTHLTAAIEPDLRLGEKLLGSLGGLFSKTWKPVRSRQIKGPSIVRGESFMRRGSHNIEQRHGLGLSAPPKVQSNPRQHPSQPTTALEKIEFERSKQDGTLSYLSDVLGELKEMVLDMGSEIDRHNKGLDHLRDDVDTLNDGVEGANRRTRRLLGR